MEAPPVGKFWARDPKSGEVSLVDADPVTVDSSALLSGLADSSDPSSPVPFTASEAEAAVEAVEAEVEAAVEVVEAEAEVEAAVEAVEAEVEVEAVEAPAPAKRGRPKKTAE